MMKQATLAMILALCGGALLCITLALLGVPQLPMLLSSEALLVVIFCLVYWWPPRYLLRVLKEKLRV